MQKFHRHHYQLFDHMTLSLAIVKILETLKRNICNGDSFPYGYRWQIGQLELLKKNFTQDIFLGIFWNFQNSFSEHPLKNEKF